MGDITDNQGLPISVPIEWENMDKTFADPLKDPKKSNSKIKSSKNSKSIITNSKSQINSKS
jgi:hypothetical protein